MMRNPIRGATLVLLIAVFCLMGCATAKLTKSQQSHTLTEQTKSGTTTGVTGEQLDVTAQRTGGTTAGTDDNRPDTGGDPGVGGESGCSDTEPP